MKWKEESPERGLGFGTVAPSLPPPNLFIPFSPFIGLPKKKILGPVKEGDERFAFPPHKNMMIYRTYKISNSSLLVQFDFCCKKAIEQYRKPCFLFFFGFFWGGKECLIKQIFFRSPTVLPHCEPPSWMVDACSAASPADTQPTETQLTTYPTCGKMLFSSCLERTNEPPSSYM